ncbi:MAG: AMP-binding protein [Acidimicrobiales bacterium]
MEEYPDIEVLRWKDADGEWASWTMQQLADETARLTTALRNLGVGAGRVVLMLMNRPEFHALDLAVMFLGRHRFRSTTPRLPNRSSIWSVTV